MRVTVGFVFRVGEGDLLALDAGDETGEDLEALHRERLSASFGQEVDVVRADRQQGELQGGAGVLGGQGDRAGAGGVVVVREDVIQGQVLVDEQAQQDLDPAVALAAAAFGEHQNVETFVGKRLRQCLDSLTLGGPVPQSGVPLPSRGQAGRPLDRSPARAGRRLGGRGRGLGSRRHLLDQRCRTRHGGRGGLGRRRSRAGTRVRCRLGRRFGVRGAQPHRSDQGQCPGRRGDSTSDPTSYPGCTCAHDVLCQAPRAGPEWPARRVIQAGGT